MSVSERKHYTKKKIKLTKRTKKKQMSVTNSMNTYYESQEKYFEYFGSCDMGSGVIVLAVNAQSCANLKTFDDLKYFISKCKSRIDVIVVSETWIKKNEVNLYSIDGYMAVHSCREKRRGGGLSIFIKNDYNVVDSEIIESDANIISIEVCNF